MATMWTRVANDFRQKELMPLKLIFLINISTVYVFYPYLTIHMRELGIAVEETAVMNAVTPFFATVTPPLTGLIADRIGNFRVLLCISSALGGLSTLLLLLVPAGRAYITYPSQIPLALGCRGKSNLEPPLQVSLLKEVPCALKENASELTGIALESCGLVCQASSNLDFSQLTSVPAYRVEGKMESHRFEQSEISGSLKHVVNSNDPRLEKLVYPEQYYKAIRVIADDQLYFPTGTLYNIICGQEKCSLKDGLNISSGWTLTDNMSTNKYIFKKKTEISSENVSTNMSNAKDFLEKQNQLNFELLTDNTTLKCVDPLTLGGLIVVIPSIEVSLRSCSPLCLASAPRNKICSDMKKRRVFDPTLTFWLYLGVLIFNSIISAVSFTMFDGALIAILRENKADYGLQRIYATIGGMISAPLTGWLMDYASTGKQYTDFRPAFYLYAVLKVIGGLLVLTIKLDFKAPAPGVAKEVLRVLKNSEVIALILACLLLGSTWGFLESFLFWLLQDLGASRSLMGLTITVGGLAGLPLLVLSGPIIAKVGHANVIGLGFVFYAIRLIGYSLLYNPWISLLFEAMEGVTSALTITAMTTYAASLSNSAVDASIQGFIGGIHYGVGRGVGSMVGGFTIKTVGTRPTYQIFASVCAGFAVLYFFFHNCFTLKRPNRKLNDITKPSKVEIQLEGVKEEIVKLSENENN
ncbi:Hypothetical predicted protein [Cloeon dipterum]|uniref:Major facilitator superfamily (MFS) profile domain-containing protein n=1 Tax=Cloeon dipterum TaxID=197152 RepID=A0A8S1CKE7_9INSE|nr:Hypothetical predicted protein [Cloeon dipterum]